jgi:hypothetical protein
MLDLDLNLLSENIRIHEQIFAETKEQLDKRCEGSKIKVQISRDDFDTLVIDLIFPCGREERHLILEHVKDVQMLLDIPFEKYIFIGSYESICSYTDGTIEAAIRTIDQQSISWLLEHEGFDKIFDSNHRQFEEEEESLSCCDQEDESTD